MAAQRIIAQHIKTAPTESLPRAVAFVVKDAKDRTPVTPVSRIDTELQVKTTPILVTRGSRTGVPRKDKKSTIEVGDRDTLAIKIQLARLNPYSNYNILTDRRYALSRSSFSPGMGAGGFWSKLQIVAQRMVKRRHSSSGFFKISWNAVLGALAPLVPSQYRGAVETWSGKEGRKVSASLGSAQMSGKDTSRVSIKIDNLVGMDPKYPTISEIRNMEAHRTLGPALQRAIDANFIKQMDLIAKKGWRDKAPQLRGLGVMVDGNGGSLPLP